MLAVKTKSVMSLRSMLEFGVDNSALLLKDVRGSTALHVAARDENVDMARVLIEYGPPGLIHMEDGVGQTPWEVANQGILAQVASSFHISSVGWIQRPVNLFMNSAPPPPVSRNILEVEVKKLRGTLDSLLQNGSLNRSTKLAKELLAFAEKMEKKLADNPLVGTTSKKYSAEGRELDPDTPPRDLGAIHNLLKEALASNAGHREPVHLLDVTKSIEKDLKEWQTVLPSIGDTSLQKQETKPSVRGVLVEGIFMTAASSALNTVGIRERIPSMWNRHPYDLFSNDKY